MSQNKTDKPCTRTDSCKDGRDHCFNCDRHLDPETAQCPKGCGRGSDHDNDSDDA